MSKIDYRLRSHHCRYCYKDGHDIRTCEKARSDANNGNIWAQNLIDRVKDRQNKQRTCSFCQKPGHNVASCMDKKLNTVDRVLKNRKYREQFTTLLKENGIGPFAMIEIAGRLYLVETVVYENVNVEKEYSHVIVFEPINPTDHRLLYRFVDLKNLTGNLLKVIQCAPEETICVNLDPLWVSGKKGITDQD